MIVVPDYSDYIVYVDESGDHSLDSINPDYPLFVLAFCVFPKTAYIRQVVPDLQAFKFDHFGHDMAVLHEHEIRKREGDFSFLMLAERRERFLAGLNQIIVAAPFTIIAAVVHKQLHKDFCKTPGNPYHLAMTFGLEQLHQFLASKGQAGTTTHVVFEARGKREDNEMELEFRRVCDGANARREHLPFVAIIVPKSCNSVGLQLADLVARPVGRHVLDPKQPNRAWDMLEPKIYRNGGGQDGWSGLMVFPNTA
jgi:hypothetical protein